MPQFRAVAASVTAKGGGVAMFRDDAGGERMTQRMRKLAGTVLLLLSIVVYSALAMAVYAWFLDGAAWWVLIGYFAIAGTLWFFPASWIIRWMAKPD